MKLDDILWEEDDLKDIYNAILRDENIYLSDKYYNLLDTHVYKLFNTSKQEEETNQNIFELCRLVYGYAKNSTCYQVVKGVSFLEVNQDFGTDHPTEQMPLIRNKYGHTQIFNMEKYKGNPSKALTASINLAKDLLENLLIIGDAEDNLMLRQYLKDFLRNPENFVQTKKHKHKHGKHIVTVTSIRKFLYNLKLPSRTNEINNFVDELKKITI